MGGSRHKKQNLKQQITLNVVNYINVWDYLKI